MKDFIVSSALTRLLANLFIFLCLVVCLFIGAWEIVVGVPINPLVYTIVSTGMAYSLMLLGVHTGIAMPQEPMNNPVSSRTADSKPIGDG